MKTIYDYMKKKSICLFLLVPLLSLKVSAQEGLETARSYGETMKHWVTTKDDELREKIEEMCNVRSTRISDELMVALVKRSTYPQHSSYMIDTFLNLIEKDSLYIEFSDFRKIDEREIIQGHRHGKDSHVEFVICRVKVRGTLSLDTKDIILVRNGKITLITRYQETNKQLSTE